jgi:hypothetical protein
VTKLLYHVGRSMVKGDAFIWCSSRFRIKVRCAAASMSPFAMKYETCLYDTRLPYEEKGDARLTLGPHAVKFQTMCSLSPHLVIF